MGEGKTRIEWIDLAKGICMILVVWIHVRMQYRAAHLAGFNWYAQVCYYFRMPLYFLLSGLFFKRYDTFGTFLCRKTDNLLIPFLTFATLAQCLPWVDYLVLHNEEAHLGFISTFRPFAPIWFLLSLFWLNMVFYATESMAGKRLWLFYPVCLLLGVAGYHAKVVPSWLHLEVAFTAIPFFALGYALRRHTSFLQDKARYLVDIPLTALLFWGLNYLCHKHHELILFDHNQYKVPVWALYLGGCLGVMGVLVLARMVKWLPGISHIGRYSIIVLITHHPIVRMINPRQVRTLVGDTHWAIAVETAAILLVSIPIIWLCRRYLPYIFAQKPVFSNLITRNRQ